MSFRPEFHSLVTIGLLGCMVSCTGAHPKTTAPETEVPPQGQEAPESGIPADEQDSLETPLDLGALQALALEDPELALNSLDKALSDRPQDGELLLLFADTTMELFRQKQVAGTLGPGLASDLLDDALGAYESALQAGVPQETGLVGLIGCYRQLGDPAAGWDAALGLFDRISADLEGGNPVAEEALLAIGQAGLDQTVASVSAGNPAPGSAHLAVLALETARAQGDAACILPLADLYAWLGDRENQAYVLAFGLDQSPNDLVLYGRLQGLGSGDRNLQVGILEQLRLDVPGQATPLWYLGEARYLQGRETRNAADFLKAMECWDRAEESFLQAMALEESYTETCRAWLHLVRTQRGWTLRDEGRIADAGATFLAALEIDPSRLEPEPSPESLHLGIDAIVGDFYGADRLKDARNLLRKVCAIHDDNSDWTNNLGFFSRDLGVQALVDGDEAAARSYFEESWDAYSRTVELSPEEARLVNDRALIAVYYLDEHWELAEQELHRSIELGMKTLAEMGPDVPESEREYFDMAVGDAWENLAFLYLNRYEEIGDSETYIKKSLEHFPFDQRTGIPPLQRKLEALRKP
ncbi:MAG: tetratricopeptide repeat protein [Planctomycetota bacterium]|jgi:tetratricopeptide (TPR) repeat protein